MIYDIYDQCCYIFLKCEKNPTTTTTTKQNKTENKNQHLAITNKGKLILLSKCVMIKNN